MVKLERSGGYEYTARTSTGRVFKGYVARRVCAVRTSATSNGPMRKHGGDRHEHMDRTLVALDEMASIKAEPMGEHGLVIRRKAG